MKQRCCNTRAKDYARYGGRGITMCARWQNSFMDFLADMGQPPTPRHSIDRIENSKGYEPGNCRWSLPIQQTRNRRCTINVTHHGETMTLMEWSKRTGINYITLHARITRFGMSTEQALTRPVRRKSA